MEDASAASGTADPLSLYPDLAGLAVHDSDDLRVGHVYGVLTEPETGLIRFLDVELDGEGRHVLVPIGHVRLEEKLGATRLRLRAARLGDLRNIPTYDPAQTWDTAYAGELAATYGRFFRGDFYYAHPAFEHDGLFAGTHPVAVPAEEAAAGENGAPLEALRDSEYRVARGEPNVMGWPVVDLDGAGTGTVADLLFEPASERVRYVVLRRLDDARVLLPVGYVDVEADLRRVRTPGLAEADLRALPGIEGALPTRAEEEASLDLIERLLDARNPFLRVEYSDRQLLP